MPSMTLVVWVRSPLGARSVLRVTVTSPSRHCFISMSTGQAVSRKVAFDAGFHIARQSVWSRITSINLRYDGSWFSKARLL